MKKETAPQTLTGLIRSRMADFQARQLAGVSQKTFAEELTAEGYPISYSDFRTLYARARKQLLARATSGRMPSPSASANANDKSGTNTSPTATRATGFDFNGTKGFQKGDLI